MKISIVTPTLAFDTALSEARASVAHQSSDVEIEHIIVVDDAGVVLPHGGRLGNVTTHFFHNTHGKGPGGARNTALDAVSGDVVFFLDADDIWQHDYIAQILAVYAAQPDVHCVSIAGLSFGYGVERPRINIPVLSRGQISRSNVAWNPVGCPSGFSYRHDAKTRDVRFKDAIYFQDLIFYLELLSIGSIFWRESDLYFWYRKSQGQLTSLVSADKVRHSQALVESCLAQWRRSGLGGWETTIAAVQIRRLSAARLRRRDYVNTLLLALLAPGWAFGQFRRLRGNRIVSGEPMPAGGASLDVAPPDVASPPIMAERRAP